MSEALKNRKAFYNTTIPVDWDAYELTRVSEKIMVGIASAATHAYRNEGIILFRNQNIKEGYLDDSDILYIDETYEKAHKNKRLKGGDILIARTGYPGTACLVPDKYIGAQSFTTLIVRPKHELIDKEFLCLYVNSEFGQGYFETNQIGGGQKNVNAGTLETMPIPLPPLPEQKAIAQVLSTADAAVHTTEKLIAQKELRKKWLMQQLLTGKKRLKGFEEEVKLKVVEHYLKEISERNKNLKITNVLSVTNSRGFINQADQFDRVVASEDATNYKIVRKKQFAYNPSRVNVGSVDLLRDFESGILSPMYVVFETDKSQLLPDYFYYQLKTQWFYGHIPMFVQGSVRDSLSFDGLCSMKFFIPSIEEQIAIAQVLQAADKEIRLLKAKAEKLREQKKGLMQVLLTGKVRLKINNT
jgi:type I restriction enzyme S subunit